MVIPKSNNKKKNRFTVATNRHVVENPVSSIRNKGEPTKKGLIKYQS
jgi:hypothetical protein